MKKVKIMLLSLALFAVVGAALAFKARFLETYCTTNPVGTTCPAANLCKFTTSVFSDEGIFKCYTTPTTYTLEDGTEVYGCYKNIGGPGVTIPLTCTSSTKLIED